MRIQLVLLLVGFAFSGPTDEFVLTRGGTLVGVEAGTEGDQVRINTFNSKNPRMTRGVETVGRAQIKSVTPDRDPVRAYLKGFATLARATDATADQWAELGVQAEKAKLDKPAAEEAFIHALAINPDHAVALARLGDSRVRELRRGDTRLDKSVAERQVKALEWPTLAERRAAYDKLRGETGSPHDAVYFERARRSREVPKGRRNDVPLTLNSKVDKGVYTIFVPESYDPLRPWPLVVGLHGGGRDGKDGKAVVGSGTSAMNFYEAGAARLGYLVVCPSAIEAPWSATPNETFVMSVLEEVCSLYNVDMNRIALTGHSMGGFGTWHFGPKHCHLWSVIAPMAGGRHGGLARLQETKTGVYLYHGADDAVVSCGDSRQAADAMQKARHDFVYTEIPDSGHGFPQDVNAEMWEFFETHRLAVAPKRALKGKFSVTFDAFSSFSRPVSPGERAYFGAPGDEPKEDPKSLLARLKLGGGAAQEAADELIVMADPALVAPLGALAADKTLSDDVRTESIRVLGRLGFVSATPHLIKALTAESLDVLTAAARALTALPDAKAGPALAKACGRVHAEFDRRRTKERLDYSDFAACLGAWTAIVGAIGVVSDPTGVGALDDLSKAILEKDWEVEASTRSGLDPKRPLAACVIAVLGACRKFNEPRTQAVTGRLVAKHSGLPGVEEAAQSAHASGGVK